MTCESSIRAAFNERLLAGELGIASEAMKPDIKEYDRGLDRLQASSEGHPPIPMYWYGPRYWSTCPPVITLYRDLRRPVAGWGPR